MSLPPVRPVRPPSCSTCPLHRSFCHFPAPLRAAFEGLKTTVALRKGGVVFHEGDRCDNVFAVCEGSVKLVMASSEGRVLLLRLAPPGDMLALAETVLGPGIYECSAVAAEESILAVIPRETFMRFIRSYPEACLSLTVALSEQYRFAQREMKFLGLGTTSTFRLAHLLMEWSGKRGAPAADDAHTPLQMTHSELAQAIGSTRETVTRILTNLTHSGIIERREGKLVLLEADALSRLLVSPEVTFSGEGRALRKRRFDLSMPEQPFAPGDVS